MRLIDRSDTSLVLALVASALVVFQQPLRLVFDVARDVEVRYDIDLLPGLTVLVGTFGFHQFKKRQQARAAALAAAAEAETERARATELERLVAFGRALGSSFEPHALRQVFWRYMPGFAIERELWMMTRTHRAWDMVVRDATTEGERSAAALEELAERALAAPVLDDPHNPAVPLGHDLCFPMVVGESA
ncbi:MAG: hypothetical protein ABL982_13585, partial [Vicinamibacterales bacterium]